MENLFDSNKIDRFVTCKTWLNSEKNVALVTFWHHNEEGKRNAICLHFALFSHWHIVTHKLHKKQENMKQNVISVASVWLSQTFFSHWFHVWFDVDDKYCCIIDERQIIQLCTLLYVCLFTYISSSSLSPRLSLAFMAFSFTVFLYYWCGAGASVAPDIVIIIENKMWVFVFVFGFE